MIHADILPVLQRRDVAYVFQLIDLETKR